MTTGTFRNMLCNFLFSQDSQDLTFRPTVPFQINLFEMINFSCYLFIKEVFCRNVVEEMFCMTPQNPLNTISFDLDLSF